jgi:hypothetical protein
VEGAEEWMKWSREGDHRANAPRHLRDLSPSEKSRFGDKVEQAWNDDWTARFKGKGFKGMFWEDGGEVMGSCVLLLLSPSFLFPLFPSPPHFLRCLPIALG